MRQLASSHLWKSVALVCAVCALGGCAVFSEKAAESSNSTQYTESEQADSPNAAVAADSKVALDAHILEQASHRFGVESVPFLNDDTLVSTVMADLNGDSVDDLLALVVGKSTDAEKTLLVYWGGIEEAMLLTRTETIRYPLPQAIDIIKKGSEDDIYRMKNQQGDAILVSKLESSSAILYWTGEEFSSHWVGD